MIVLNMLGKIEPICISQKLKLFIANLPKEDFNNWNGYLVDEMQCALKRIDAEQEKIKNSKKFTLESYFLKNFPGHEFEINSAIQTIADNMVCLYFDYQYEDMPLGGWETNCFDGRFCEGDYAEKVIEFINFICGKDIDDSYPQVPEQSPWCIYSSNKETQVNDFVIFSGTTNIAPLIESLVQVGKLIDNFLISENDYYCFDYLCNELFNIDQEHNANSCQRIYSLCEFFLEKEKDSELDKKLPQFLPDVYDAETKEKIARIARRVRNKVSHGDFMKFNEQIEQYATEVMDGHFCYDYSEYSRKQWAINDLCINLLRAVKKLIYVTLTDRKYINQIKQEKIKNY